MVVELQHVRQLEELNKNIVACRRCPRLTQHCRKVAEEKRAAYRGQDYWGKPVPNFGDPEARVLLVGLAPAAHGGNRTGRIFTGDRSGDFLFTALHRVGFASQPHSIGPGDGLSVQDCFLTAVAHCAPPGNKLTPEEVENCRHFLTSTFSSLPHLRVVIALGKVAYDACVRLFRCAGEQAAPFAHGAETTFRKLTLLGSYHPSQQNTFTGKLNAEMFDAVLLRARALAGLSTGPPSLPRAKDR